MKKIIRNRRFSALLMTLAFVLVALSGLVIGPETAYAGDFAVSAWVDPEMATAGQNVRIYVELTATEDARGIKITDGDANGPQKATFGDMANGDSKIQNFNYQFKEAELGKPRAFLIVWTTGEGEQEIQKTQGFSVTAQKPDPGLTIEITANNNDKPVPEGGKVTFSCKVTNTGNVTIGDIEVTDSVLGTMLGTSQTKFSLEPGKSHDLPVATHTMSDSIIIKPSVTGKVIIGNTTGASVNATGNEIRIDKAVAGLTVSAIPDKTEIESGELVILDGTVINSGTVDFASVTVTDSLGNTILKDWPLDAGDDASFKHEVEITDANYVLYAVAKDSNGREAGKAEFPIAFKMKLTTDDVRVDMAVEAEPAELTKPGEVKLTFIFNNPRSEPLKGGMRVEEKTRGTIISLATLKPGETIFSGNSIEIEESTVLRFELLVKDGDEDIVAGSCVLNIEINAQDNGTSGTPGGEDSSLGWLWTLLIVVGVLLVAAAVVFVVLISQEKKAKKKQKPSTRGNVLPPRGGVDGRRPARQSYDDDDAYNDDQGYMLGDGYTDNTFQSTRYGYGQDAFGSGYQDDYNQQGQQGYQDTYDVDVLDQDFSGARHTAPQRQRRSVMYQDDQPQDVLYGQDVEPPVYGGEVYDADADGYKAGGYPQEQALDPRRRSAPRQQGAYPQQQTPRTRRPNTDDEWPPRGGNNW
jgi:uncharacterized repeat protein (TIGR01451 family)